MSDWAAKALKRAPTHHALRLLLKEHDSVHWGTNDGFVELAADPLELVLADLKCHSGVLDVVLETSILDIFSG